MDFYDITAQEILDRLSRNCPESLWTYIQCITRMDEDGLIFFTRHMVERDMSYSWTKFKNNLKRLSLENLMEWHIIDEGISVTVYPIDDE